MYACSYSRSANGPNKYKHCRCRKCIQGHIPINASDFAIFIYFFIPVLSGPSLTSRTPNEDVKIEQLFCFLLIQVPSPGVVLELCCDSIFCSLSGVL